MYTKRNTLLQSNLDFMQFYLYKLLLIPTANQRKATTCQTSSYGSVITYKTAEPLMYTYSSLLQFT